MKSWMLLSAFVLSAFAQSAPAACPSDLDAALMAARFAHLEPVANPGSDLSMADAICGRDKYTKFLAQNYGRVVGYKAGLTNSAVQKRFGVTEPLRGTLFEKMILQDGSEVPAKFGARPVVEADLVVEVRDSGINRAKTPLDALRHLSRIYPFIELVDVLVENPKGLTGPAIAYVNVGARLGVLGKPIEVRASPALLDSLASMTVRFLGDDGKELSAAKGSALLDHPMNVVLWLAEDLRKSGGALKKGQLLSLGTYSRPVPPKPGTEVKVVYDGLPGNPSVSVRFK